MLAALAVFLGASLAPGADPAPPAEPAPAAWATATASTTPQSTLDDPTLDEPATPLELPDAPPLSAEELALIEAITADPSAPIDTTTTARAHLPELALDRARLQATVPRSLGEALLGLPTTVAGRRNHVAGDDLLVHGRGGTRPRVELDGLGLDHALTRFDDRAELGMLDPWSLERVVLGLGDRLTLTSLAPRDGLHTTAQVLARSADRSSAVVAQADGTVGPLGLLLGGSYVDLGPLRTDGQLPLAPWPYQRASLRGRAVLTLPASITLTAGADLDRLTNVEDRTTRDETRLRRTGFVDAALSQPSLRARLVVGLREHQLEREAGAPIPREQALTWEGRAEAALRVGPLWLGGRAGLVTSDAELELLGQQRTGQTRSLDARATLALATDLVELSLDVGVDDRVTTLDLTTVDSTALVTDGHLLVRPLEPLGLVAAWRYDHRLPSAGDLAERGTSLLLPERSLLLELGPVLHLSTVEVELLGHARWLERALEPVLGGRAAYVEGAVMAGAEARALWRPRPELWLRAALGWTAADRVLAGVPGLVGAASARWQAGPDTWALELAGRGLWSTAEASLAEAPPPTLSAVERREWDGVILSVRGVVPIAVGFVLSLTIDNTFDVRTRGYGGAINDPGIDLRAALSHRW
jgi:hypothetical protein